MTDWLVEFERTDAILSRNTIPSRAASVPAAQEAPPAEDDAAAAPAVASAAVRQNAETAECRRDAAAAITEFVRIARDAAPGGLCFDPLHRSAAVVEACAEEGVQCVSLPGAVPHQAMAWMQGLADGDALARPISLVLADLTEELEPGQTLRQLVDDAGRLMKDDGVLAVLVADAALAVALRAVGGEVRVRALAEEGYGCLLLDLPGVAANHAVHEPSHHQQQHEHVDDMIAGEQTAEEEEAAAMAPPGGSEAAGQPAVRHHYFDRQQLDRYGTVGVTESVHDLEVRTVRHLPLLGASTSLSVPRLQGVLAQRPQAGALSVAAAACPKDVAYGCQRGAAMLGAACQASHC